MDFLLCILFNIVSNGNIKLMMYVKSVYCYEIFGIVINWKEVDVSVLNKVCEYIMGC